LSFEYRVCSFACRPATRNRELQSVTGRKEVLCREIEKACLVETQGRFRRCRRAPGSFLTVLFAGSIENIFSPKVKLQARIEINGLRAGAPVWLYGIEVGSVSGIRLDAAHETIITLSVGNRYLGFIRKDARVSVLTMGLLGDKYVDLAAGSPEAPPIGPGDVIQGAVRRDIATAGAESMAKITEVIARLERLFAKIEEGEGTLAKLINDPSLYNNLNGATRNLTKVARDMANPEGTVSKLINDPSLYDNLRDATQTLAQVSREMMMKRDLPDAPEETGALREPEQGVGELSATIENSTRRTGSQESYCGQGPGGRHK
jgi:ABC-type transporter Mla subunit MlaD